MTTKEKDGDNVVTEREGMEMEIVSSCQQMGSRFEILPLRITIP